MVKTGAKPRDAPDRKTMPEPAPAAPTPAATAATDAAPAPPVAVPKPKPDWITSTLELYPGGEDADELPEAATEIRDIMADANTLKWAGISLGKA